MLILGLKGLILLTSRATPHSTVPLGWIQDVEHIRWPFQSCCLTVFFFI